MKKNVFLLLIFTLVSDCFSSQNKTVTSVVSDNLVHQTILYGMPPAIAVLTLYTCTKAFQNGFIKWEKNHLSRREKKQNLKKNVKFVVGGKRLNRRRYSSR